MERIEWTPLTRQWIADDPKLVSFTDRQRVVVRLIANGLSVEAVSDHLGLGNRTVRNDLALARMRVEIARMDGLVRGAARSVPANRRDRVATRIDRRRGVGYRRGAVPACRE